MAELSDTEARALVNLSARGSGLPWALCHELADAFVVLQKNNVAADKALCTFLESYTRSCGHACPLRQALYLEDVARMRAGLEVTVWNPLIFVGTLAKSARFAVEIQGPRFVASVVGQEISLDCLKVSEEKQTLLLNRFAIISDPMLHGSKRVNIDSNLVERLKQLAALTYVPESEESRRRGAG